MKCSKVVLVVAGYGTRFLPLTRAIEKCMVPLGARPMIDYIVEDCRQAGIRDFYFVVGKGSQQLRNYYAPKPELAEHLKQHGKEAMLPLVEPPSDCTFTFIEQDPSGAYGTAVPVSLASHLAGPDEQVLVIMGDQIFYHADGQSEAAHFLQVAEQAGAASAMLVAEVPHKEVYKYGIVATKKVGDVELFDRVVEKPRIEDAPTNLNNASFYLFDQAFFEVVSQYVASSREGEYHVTDPLNTYVEAGNNLAVVRAKGQYLDCGNPESWLVANNVVMRESLPSQDN